MDHGEFDVEAQILKDGNLTMGRRFESRKMAIQWAELERRSLVTDC
jgi:hypothetical protein